MSEPLKGRDGPEDIKDLAFYRYGTGTITGRFLRGKITAPGTLWLPGVISQTEIQPPTPPIEPDEPHIVN